MILHDLPGVCTIAECVGLRGLGALCACLHACLRVWGHCAHACTHV